MGSSHESQEISDAQPVVSGTTGSQHIHDSQLQVMPNSIVTITDSPIRTVESSIPLTEIKVYINTGFHFKGNMPCIQSYDFSFCVKTMKSIC